MNDRSLLGIILSYTLKICYSNRYNISLIGPSPGRKHRWGDQTKDDGKEKAELGVPGQIQREQEMNI